MRKLVRAEILLLTILFLSACVPIQAPTASQKEESVVLQAEEPVTPVIASAADVPRIGAREAKEHYDNGTAIFVDSRSQTTYDQLHITGALPPPSEPYSEILSTIPKDQLIITYCT